MVRCVPIDRHSHLSGPRRTYLPKQQCPCPMPKVVTAAAACFCALAVPSWELSILHPALPHLHLEKNHDRVCSPMHFVAGYRKSPWACLALCPLVASFGLFLPLWRIWTQGNTHTGPWKRPCEPKTDGIVPFGSGLFVGFPPAPCCTSVIWAASMEYFPCVAGGGRTAPQRPGTIWATPGGFGCRMERDDGIRPAWVNEI